MLNHHNQSINLCVVYLPDNSDPLSDGEHHLLHPGVVLDVLVELMQLLASDISLIIEKCAERIVHHDDAILLQHIIHGKLIILDVGFLVGINENNINWGKKSF